MVQKSNPTEAHLKPKVLIIDDEDLLVKSTCMALGFFNYEAKGALDGPEGLKTLHEFDPDLVLLDIMMPGMDGWEVLAKLKEDPAACDIPVIIFTAKEYSNGRKLAQSKGAVDYLPKPFQLDHLDLLLKQHARKRSA